MHFKCYIMEVMNYKWLPKMKNKTKFANNIDNECKL